MAFLMAGLTIGLMLLARDWEPLLIWYFEDSGAATAPILPFLAITLFSIPMHELLHVATHPHFGLTSNSVLGLWLSRGIFYAHFEGEMSRNRFLAVLAMPFLVLSLLPLVVIAVIGESGPSILPGFLFVLALVNSVLAVGDALGFVVIFSQFPGFAVVRNKGYESYWKHK